MIILPSLLPELTIASGVARARSLVGHKYGKWSLVALSLTTPQINTAESQSLAYNPDYFCPILTELKG